MKDEKQQTLEGILRERNIKTAKGKIERGELRYLSDLELREIPVGTEIIVERMHWAYKDGRPTQSDYYRTTLDRKKKTALMYRDEEILRKAANDEYPLNAPWTMEHIPAANDNLHRLWIKKGADSIGKEL